MPNTPSTAQPDWLRQYNASAQGRRCCLGFTFNNEDYILSDDVPRDLMTFLVRDFYEAKGYDLVVTYCLSEGVQIAGFSEERQRLLQRHSGLTITDTDPQTPPPLVTEVLQGMTRLLRQDCIRVAVILKYAEHIAPSTQGMGAVAGPEALVAAETLHSWSVDAFIPQAQNTAVLVLREGHYHELIDRHWHLLKVNLPNTQERIKMIGLLLGLREKPGREPEFAPLDPSLTVEEYACLASGLSLRVLEQIARRAAAEGQTISRQLVQEVKACEIERAGEGLLEVLATESGFESIAGLGAVKSYLSLLVRQLRRGSKTIPRVLLVGVPGVGKSYIVRAFAREVGFNCVQMRAVRSMWVGESERNLERVFNTLVGLKPVILFIDEADQNLGRRTTGTSGDAGTSERMLARLWEFMASEEHRGEILFIGASNRPDLLDPASLDRFGVVIPFLHPTSAELVELLPILVKQLGRTLAKGIELTPVAQELRTRLMSTRQCLDVVSRAALLADEQAKEMDGPISQDHLMATARSFRSSSNRFTIERIALEAVRMTSFEELLPWSGDPKEYEFPAYLQSLVDPQTGNVDWVSLEARVHELERIGI